MKKAPLILAAIWLVARIVINQTGIVSIEEEINYSVMLNMLLLIIAIYAGLKEFRFQEVPFLEMAKAGMRSAALYAVFMGLGLFMFYQFIAPDYLELRINKVHEIELADIAAKGGWEEVQKKTPELKDKDQESFFEERKDTMLSLFTPWFIASTGMFVMLLLGLLYSLVATFFQRKMVQSLKK